MFPLQGIWQKTNKNFFECEWGVVAYEQVGHTFVAAGDPMASNLDEQIKTLHQFQEYVRSQRGRLCGYYFSKEVAEESGLRAHMLGVSRLLDFEKWSLQGKDSEEFRRALRKGKKAQLQVEELTPDEVLRLGSEIQELENRWRKTKPPYRIGFLLSELQTTLKDSKTRERFFICRERGQVTSLISLVRYGGSNYCWYMDHMIQDPEGHKFAIDYLLSRVVMVLQKEGAKELSLGLCPMIVNKKNLSWLERIVKSLSHLQWLYSAKGLYVFKRKYSNKEKPRYFLIEPRQSLFKQLHALQRVTFYQ